MKKLSTKQLVMLAVLTALHIIAQGVLKIDFGGVVQIGLSFVFSALIGAVFGPAIAFIAGGIADVIAFFLFPGGYEFFLGYTLSAALAPMIYALFLYKTKRSIYHIFASVLIITLFVNMGLGTLWVSILRGKSYFAYLFVRTNKNIISLFVNTIVLTYLLEAKPVKDIIRKYEL